jgi:hypothetical protein
MAPHLEIIPAGAKAPKNVNFFGTTCLPCLQAGGRQAEVVPSQATTTVACFGIDAPMIMVHNIRMNCSA